MSVIHHADVLDALRAMPDNSFHGCLTDPPYGLSFMGHQWDHGVPSAEVWREVLRVLRPGAAMLAFGGTRTFHRLTCAIEDAGFEVRDCMMWLYGSGFPKSHDVSKAIDREAGAKREVVGKSNTCIGPSMSRSRIAHHVPDHGNDWQSANTITAPATEAARQWEGHGTALKPAWEPIILARKPLDGTVAANVQRWGCGALAIDASRVEGLAEKPGGKIRTVRHFDGHETGRADKDAPEPNPLGRWPANVIFDEEAGAALDAQSGHLHGAGSRQGPQAKWSPAKAEGWGNIGTGPSGARFGDSGGASRFFKQCDYTEEDARFMYCAKASRKERDAGVEGGSSHPCVKPLALTTYLARLILPPVEGARLLVPFCGSGSEMLGGTRAGWSHVEGIDSWDVAVKIARARTA